MHFLCISAKTFSSNAMSFRVYTLPYNSAYPSETDLNLALQFKDFLFYAVVKVHSGENNALSFNSLVSK
jgi:hypothetical protein